MKKENPATGSVQGLVVCPRRDSNSQGYNSNGF